MPSNDTLGLFALAALVLIVVPGPAVLYIVAQSIDRGRLAGVVSALGVAAGGLAHVAAAAVGLSALLVSSSAAFTAVKLCGAAYLVGVGIWTLLRRPDAVQVEVEPRRPLRRLFAQGIVVNVLNPKTALFFLAFLPQFVDPDRGVAVTQVLVLGVLFVLLAVLSDCVWALAAGTASRRLRRHRSFLAVRRYVSGSVFVSLGALTAVARRH